VTTDDKAKDRDWDREMREVDRLLAKLPAADVPPTVRRSDPTVPRPALPHAHPPAAPPGALGTWIRVLLAVLAGAGMTQWPYTHGCGIWLFTYLGGVGAIIAAGLWSAVASWKARLAFAHVVSMLVIVWGLALAAREVLPRVGYANLEGPWLCPDVTPTPRVRR
jgi:hypothetical protein